MAYYQGFGIFIALCGITFMLEVKDSKNRHFIIGDCYNNFLYNTDQSITHQANRKLTVLPTILRFVLRAPWTTSITSI